MDIKRAKAITKTFININKKRKPVLANDWEFIKKYERIFVYSKQLDIEFYFSTLLDYTNFYIFGERKNDVVSNKLQESAYYTSLGFVSIDDFFLAEDILENQSKFKLSEMEDGKVYISDKGKEYLFIKEEKVKITFYKNIDSFLYKNISFKNNVLYDILEGKLIKFSSANLFQKSDTVFDFNYYDFHLSEYDSQNIIDVERNYSFLDTSIVEVISLSEKYFTYIANSPIIETSIIKEIRTFLDNDDTKFKIEKTTDVFRDFNDASSKIIKKSYFFGVDMYDNQNDLITLREDISLSLSSVFEDMNSEELNINELVLFFNYIENHYYFTKSSWNIRSLLYFFDKYWEDEKINDIFEALHEFSFSDNDIGFKAYVEARFEILYFIEKYLEY